MIARLADAAVMTGWAGGRAMWDVRAVTVRMPAAVIQNGAWRSSVIRGVAQSRRRRGRSLEVPRLLEMSTLLEVAQCLPLAVLRD